MSDASREPSRLEAISTRWSLLEQARQASLATAGEARSALVLRYLPAVRRYVGAMLEGSPDAEDVAQDVAVRLLAGEFGGATPERGRFRDLLKTAIRNMVRKHWRRENRRRASDLDLETVPSEQSETDDPWLIHWRRHVLDLAWRALQQQEAGKPGSHPYTLLQLRMGHPEATSDELARLLSQHVGRPCRADAVRQQLRRARLQFADLLIAEIGGSLDDPTPQRIDDELVALGLLDFVRDLLPARRSDD